MPLPIGFNNRRTGGVYCVQNRPEVAEMERVRLYDEKGNRAACRYQLPRRDDGQISLAADRVKDGRLHDPVLRENFIARIFVT